MPDTSVTPAPIPPAIPRGWRSLLTGRWHRSSWVVAALVLLLLVFCNVPGQAVTWPVDELTFAWLPWIPKFEHGWPATWAVTQFVMTSETNCWGLGVTEREVYWRALLLNAAVATGAAAGMGAVFELWRRARQHWWQLHLRDLLALLFLLSLAGSWYAGHQRRRTHELQVVGAGEDLPYDGRSFHGIVWCQTSPGGATWLRQIAGERHFSFLDRVIAVKVEPRGIGRCSKLADVRLVSVVGFPTDEQLAPLAAMPNLETLFLTRELTWPQRAFTREGKSEPVYLPRLPHLRHLRLNNVNGKRLDNLPLLESLDWFDEPINETVIQELAKLPHFCTLHLRGRDFGPQVLPLLEQLPNVENLDLSWTAIDGNSVEGLGKLKQLRELQLLMEAFSDEECQRLATLLPDCVIFRSSGSSLEPLWHRPTTTAPSASP